MYAIEKWLIAFCATLGIDMASIRRTSRGAINMGQLFLGFILILVGLVLYPTIQTTVDTTMVNATGATQAVGELIPLLWVLIVVGIGVALVYQEFKDMD